MRGTAGRPSTHSVPGQKRRNLFAWVGFAGAVTVAVLFLNLRDGTPEAPILEAIPLTSDPGLELEPRLSPDGRTVAYVWNGPAADNFDVYMKPAAAGSPRRLTTSPEHEYSPAWSPDGSSIAYLRQTGTDRAAVMIVPASGGQPRRIAETAAHSWPHWHFPGPFLEWSPDGKWLVVPSSALNGAFGLARLSVQTGEIQPLTSPPAGGWGDAAPSISADGRQLAFSRVAGWALSDLYTVPLSQAFTPNGPPSKVRTGAKWNASPAWLLDGRLVFSTGTLQAPHLALVKPSGRATVQSLGLDSGHGWQPSAARRESGGLELAFTRHFEAVNIWRQELSGNPPPSRWIASSRRDLTPEYSPDGKRIAFTSDRGGSEEIWVAAGDGSDPQPWTSFNGAHVGAPRWFPDGRQIVFDAEVGGKFRIYSIESQGARPRILIESDQPVWLPVCSRNGETIVFAARWTGRTQLWRIPSNGGRAVEVGRQEASNPWFSPDGRYLYYLGGGSENHVWRMPCTGGEPQLVVEWVGAFTVADRGVYFTRFRPGEGLGDTAVYFHDLATGATTTVVRETARLRPGLAVSPDGRSLLFAQVAYDVSDLVLARQK